MTATMQSMVVGAPTVLGAPAMTSMYATPSASMYATPGAMTSMYMPAAAPTVVETVAAPQYAAAPTVVETFAAPSYVAAPTMMQTVAAPVVEVDKVNAVGQVVERDIVAAPAVAVAQWGVPAPVKLTEGLVTPDKIEAERLAYEKALAAQLKKQSDAVMEECKIKQKMLDQTAKTQLAEFQLQAEETFKMQCLQVDQEAQTLVNGLKEAAITQQTAREEAAAIAIADYKKKAALEEAAKKSWDLQKQWHDAEMKMAAEYQKVAKAGASSVVTAANPTIPVTSVV